MVHVKIGYWASCLSAECAASGPSLSFRIELALRGAADRADPVVRQFLKRCIRRDASIWVPYIRIILISTYFADINRHKTKPPSGPVHPVLLSDPMTFVYFSWIIFRSNS